MPPTCSAAGCAIVLHGDPGPFTVHLQSREEDGVWYADLELVADAPALPPQIELRWSLPAVGVLAQWRGDCDGSTGAFPPDWGSAAVSARACSQAPVLCLYGIDGISRLTCALADAVNASRLLAGVCEEDGTMACCAAPFAGPRAAATRFGASLRLDRRPLPWHAALDAVAAWWEREHPPAVVPDAGRLPMYSTWYSLHQAVDDAAVEHQCRLAQRLGCSAVIIDDGWQTLDGSRGYAFCGDWDPERIPDMRGLVDRVHALGMRVLLWYAVPYIGFRSRSWAGLRDRCLAIDERKGAGVLDPRYPEVRERLIGQWLAAQRDWGIDGFKLDFVDAFAARDAAGAQPRPGMDIDGVDDAVIRLLDDGLARLRASRPDTLIEFRQSYIGPAMRRFGHLFRAGDCPADAIGNRKRTLDIRMLCRSTAAHADMLMWHAEEPVEGAALQLLNVLFAVPQISVLLDRVPESHRRMLAFWLAWWTERRSCLLDGALSAEHPEARYTQASARDASRRITCLYAREPARLGSDDPPLIELVNATAAPGILIEISAPWRGRILLRDTTGSVVEQRDAAFQPGVHLLAVPPAGLACLATDAA
jgi:alpha-galactosidase